MLEERKNEWVAALRSGKYKQGTGMLTSVEPDGSQLDCCLGVSCKLAPTNRLNMLVQNKAGMICYDSESGILPSSVVIWMGMNTASGQIQISDGDYHSILNVGKVYPSDIDLTDLNDDVQLTFEQIADVIEHFWQEL